MTDKQIITLLKVVMCFGLLLILLGIYLHNFSETMESMGVTGIIISAVCVAVGMALSLPTKMYLTFIWVKREAQKRNTNTS
ncbi:hypothetical protein QTP81_06830 [Alteromonas sp. ASW11-36]|uniref:Uncharacterized protein n=1 Tax=Alteromonas arenosi TaxID=3055817 RepID=A0ABT7SVS6_9ALTE|nr:hypothetical protein [Alteromonas sp. ASW11-36]MDM7860305.1 hypothetical protein [Alteromonas sp. ASW11-36]